MHLCVFVLIFACYKVAKQPNATIPHGDKVPTPWVVIDVPHPMDLNVPKVEDNLGSKGVHKHRDQQDS